MSVRTVVVGVTMLLALPTVSDAQTNAADGWHVMQDAAVFGMFNHQGGRRGGDEFRVPNWWMGMFSRPVKSGELTINAMLSLDPATVGKRGYRELFQVGETFNGRPLVDYQHPHDVFMQIAAIWRIPIGTTSGFTIAGGPAAEPALGPVAFMHRAAAMENPMAPLSHHTFDSTHIAFGVVTAAVDRGTLTAEFSVFNGREPDEDRWDFDLGPLDSVSGRLWFRPREEWEFQVSSGRLKSPEELGHGKITRTTASASWLKRDGGNFTAATAAVGVNATEDGDRRSFLVEATRTRGMNAWYGRFELVEVETGTFLDDDSIAHAVKNRVAAVTVGGVRALPSWRRLESGIGAAVTFYGVPEPLEFSHGSRPVSFQAFVRFRPSPGPMGRMWNMHMIKPMHPAGTDPHAGHQMP